MIEIYTSRTTDEYAEGTNMRRVFQMTYTEFDNSFDIFVGNALGDSTSLDANFTTNPRNLRVRHIGQTGIDNTNTYVNVNYSSENSPTTAGIPDQAASWVESFDITTYDNPQTSYYDTVTGAWVDWEGDASTTGSWLNLKPAAASDTVPELSSRKGNMVFRVTCYGSTMYLKRTLDRIGLVNGVNFVNGYFQYSPQDTITKDFTTFADAGKWLLSACPTTRTAKNTWRYEFMFEFNRDGWNIVDGASVNLYGTKNPDNTSQSLDFNDLFIGMDGTDSTDVSQRVNR